jgi:hypothetical protein
MPIGTVSHETGHAFGLPDLYDTGTGTEGIGEWGIMGSGNYSRPYSPSSYDPWSLNELGWVTIDTLGASRTVTTGARQLSDTAFLAPMDDNAEFLLLENRQAVGTDTALLNPDNTPPPACGSKCRKVPGLMLWHIDLDRIAAGRGGNSVNTGSVQGVAVEQADGLNQLRIRSAGRNRGDQGDPYPGSTGNTAWRLRGEPSAETNAGIYAGFIIDHVQQLANQVMSFRFVRRQPTLVVPSASGFAVEVDGTSYPGFRDVIPAGDTFHVAIDSIESAGNGGRSIGRFLNWSNGGPREQTVISGAKPDTLVANLSVEHLLQVTVEGNGSGSYQSALAGDLTTGVFVQAGTPVTLTATPAAGSVFGGWSGDTVAFTASLALAMERPYNLVARFLTDVAVPLEGAAQEVLGTATLTLDQKSFADQIGNRNGTYDVGDYLALVRRSDQTSTGSPPTEAARRGGAQ